MSNTAHKVRPETANDAAAVDALIQRVFGPGVSTRAASALREGVDHVPALAFVAQVGGMVSGSIRFTPVLWGETEVLMLGPLGVARHHAGQGIGRALMQAGMAAAREACGKGGHDVVMLVGDLGYYKPFGFQRIDPHRITLPRPVDPKRVLGCEFVDGALKTCSGDVLRSLSV